MKTKWSVIVLLILGALAALFASILMGVLLGGGGDDADSVEVVMAAKTLPAMSVISSRHIVTGKALTTELPEGYLTNPIQAIGKVLSVRVVEGQVLTKYCFVTEGSGAQLASALPYGMRAVSIPISTHSLMGGLLYPGCIVDVLASFTLRSSRESKGQAVSTTLLHGVQVLAVEASTIVSKPDEGKADSLKQRSVRSGSVLTVTLMVDTRQAEALQLAMENGRVSLAMRNPQDKRPVDVDVTVLSEGRLAKLGSLLEPSVRAAQEGVDWAEEISVASASMEPNSLGRDTFSEQSGSAAQLRKLFSGALSDEDFGKKLQWEMTIIRGSKVTEEVVDMSKTDSSAEKSEEE